MHEFHLLIYLRQFAHWFQKRGSMRLLITWQKERSNPKQLETRVSARMLSRFRLGTTIARTNKYHFNYFQVMIILWKADYDGDDIQRDLEKLNKINSEVQKKLGGKIEGPYFPQDASVLYIFNVKEYEWLNKAGRIWFDEAKKANLQFVPKTYEVAVTPDEFFGK